MENIKILFDLLKSNKKAEFLNYIKENKNININNRDEYNNYLINYAININDTQIISALINRGANLDITDDDGRSILYVPIKYNYYEVIDLLLYFNSSSIGISLVDIKDKQGNTALHYAIKHNNMIVIDKLLKFNANLDIKNDEGFNSIHLAIFMKNVEVCKKFINKDIDINAQNTQGESYLHMACNFELEQIVKLLIKHGIDVNMKEYSNEYTALMYGIMHNNINIINDLLNHGANVNIQDYFGNTAIHYSIEGEKYPVINILLNNKKINMGLYNGYNKLPIHLALENESFDENILRKITEMSSMNFQDDNGNTPMHYISKRHLWKPFYDILSKKKLNIFIYNKQGNRPIDYIKNNKELYIKLIVDSYIYVIRNHNYTWKESWENMCKKDMFQDKMTKEESKIILGNINEPKKEELCRQIINNKIVKLEKNKNEVCNISYPKKLNSTCISFGYAHSEMCKFTGITLDVLMGLIYLLKKHKSTCSTISKQFIENRRLCDYYKSIGIVTNTRCEFLNFEIIWIYQKLYFSEEFVDNFKKCTNNPKSRFLIVPIGIELKNGSHSNYLIYDKKLNEIERFEPYGTSLPYLFDYKPTILDNILQIKINAIDPSIKYITPNDYLDKISFQYIETIERKKTKIGDPEGFCALWSIWYVDMRITYEDIPRKKLVKKLIKSLKLNRMSFRDMIRNYSKDIEILRDDILDKSNLTINNWINDQYTEDQVVEIIKNVTLLIEKYIS